MMTTAAVYCTVGHFIETPLEKWSPKSLMERTDDASIPFETSVTRDLIGMSLSQNEKDLQSVYDEAIKPLIELQKKYRQELEEKKISATTVLSEEDRKNIMESAEKYKDKLGVCSWVLPAEGFGTEAILKEAGVEVPKCLGMLQLLITQAMQQEQP
jgi:hypothetical protein